MRSTAATVVGWLIVALLAFWFLGLVVGTIAFLARFVIWLIVIAALVTLYARLKA